MWVAMSLLVLVLGAVLHYAVADTIDGVNLSEVGVILLAAGGVGFLAACFALVADRRSVVDRETVGPDGRAVSQRERRSM